MKLYTFDAAPNARRVTLFMQYKGIEIETTQIAMMEKEQLGDDYKKINPVFRHNTVILQEFIGAFWDYYHLLKAYKREPTPDPATPR